jgi:pilus assembly protein Flp/PilA
MVRTVHAGSVFLLRACKHQGIEIMTKFITKFFRDENGAAAAEYALILAIVGAGIAGAAALLGTSISNAMDRTGGIIDDVNVAPVAP